jgi:phenylacetate-coenzyme A ligase PaaK-like adenylate-forming protein
MRMMFCSEEFSERWRRYVAERAGIKPDLKSLVNVYGASDMLLIGYETPISIFRRAMAEGNLLFRSRLFGKDTVVAPQLFQYNPLIRYIESENRELLFTSASGIPLIRFNMHDAGNIIPYRDVMDTLGDIMPDWKHVFEKQGGGTSLWQLPFIALRGRNDQTVIFYAVNIYPDHVRIALDHEPFFNKITGKFTLHKRYTKRMDTFLELHIELRNGIQPNPQLAEQIRNHVVRRLKEINMEYCFICDYNPDKDLRPRIKLWPYQHPKYFKLGTKPRYIIEE